MTPQAPPAAGRFVWYEILTPSPEKSVAFYCELLGWKTKQAEMGGAGSYTSFLAGSESVAGVHPLDPAQGAPPHWIAYITVDDVDDAARRVEHLGGTIRNAPVDVPGVGRFAVAADPAGAAFCPFKFSDDAPPESEGPPPVGTFCWNELLTRDPQAISGFYAGIFGWKTREMPMGAMGNYLIFSRGEKDEAGSLQMPPGSEAPPFWLAYIAVADVDAAAAKIVQLGGKVFVPPTDIPSVGRFAVAADVTGASFAVFKGA